MTCRFTIYCHTNKVNGKRYIGQTVDTMEGRWSEHISAARQGRGARIFGAAIRKYGIESFDHEILEVVEGSQKDADDAEARWIKNLGSRSPDGYNLAAGGGGPGYHHEDSKRLIGEASSRHWREMTPEQRSKKVQTFRSNPEKRLARLREVNTTKEFSEKVRSGQKKFWANLSPEEKTRRVKHQQSGISPERKSARIRDAWSRMTPEAREARVRKAAASIAAVTKTPAYRKQKSEWQTAQAKLRTPEQRREMVLKSWATRRAKYGADGVKRTKTSEEYSASTAQGWANMTPEARAERVRKTQEGRRKAKEARLSRLVRINLFAPAIQ
jgi:group I intron endonuclease